MIPLASLLLLLQAPVPGQMTLAWDAPDDASLVAGYRIHWGNAPGAYTAAVDVGLATEAKVSLPGPRGRTSSP